MLTIRNLSITFNPGTALENQVIRRLDLSADDGEFITLLGSNGAGKSTLLNLIAGTCLADEGTIELDGREISGRKAHERARLIGRVHQDPRLSVSPNMTLLENLALADAKGNALSLRRAVDLRRVSAYREKLRALNLGLEDKLQTRIGSLSGGQRQAVALFMAVMKNPRLLLLDEHTAALDPKTSGRIMELTDRLIRDEGITTLMVTHNLQHALEYGGRLVMMHEGQIAADVRGQEKSELSADTLIRLFQSSAGELDDRLVLGL